MKQLLRPINSMWGWCNSCRYIRNVHYARLLHGYRLLSPMGLPRTVCISYLYVWQPLRTVIHPTHHKHINILALWYLAAWLYILRLLTHNSLHKGSMHQKQHSLLSVNGIRESSLWGWTKIGVVITCYGCCSHLCRKRRNIPQSQAVGCNHQ